MASTTSADWPGRVLNHQDYAAALTERRAELGNPELPRNTGTRRTPHKRALLAAIEKAGGRW